MPWRLLQWLGVVATMALAIDAFTVREERREEEKGGALWGLTVAMSPLMSASTGVALAGVDTVAVPLLVFINV